MEISNRLPDTDTVSWEAIVMIDTEEETFRLDLPSWLDVSEVQEEFVTAAQDTYWLDSFPVILQMTGPDGTIY